MTGRNGLSQGWFRTGYRNSMLENGFDNCQSRASWMLAWRWWRSALFGSCESHDLHAGVDVEDVPGDAPPQIAG
jgi:hypothetical protein